MLEECHWGTSPVSLLLIIFFNKYTNFISVQLWLKQTCKICGNKMPTRCNRGFYCRSYCLPNMFQAPLCPSSGAQEYYTVVAAWGISCCGFQVAGLVWSWGLCVRFAGQHLANWTHNPQLHTRPATWKPQHEIPQAATTVQYSWAHMMGTVVPETCWASNNICNKNLCCN